MTRKPPTSDRSTCAEPYASLVQRERHLVDHDGTWWLVGGRRADGTPTGQVEKLSAQGVEPGPALPRDWQPGVVVSSAGAMWAIGGTRRPHEPVATVRTLRDGDEEWSPAPRLPRPLRRAGVGVFDGGILVAGGLGAGAVFGPSEWLRDAWWLASGDDRWQPVARVPAPRASGQLFGGSDGRARWVGGEVPEGEAEGALVWERRSDTWATVPCGPVGLGARGVAMLSDGTIVLAGGHRTVRDTSRRRFGPDHHPVVGRCHRVDLVAGTVTPLPDLCVPRRHASVVAIDKSAVLVIGGEVNGRERDAFLPVDTVERLDVEEWTIALEAPLSRACSAPVVGVREDEVVVVGGRGAGGEPGGLERRTISPARRG